MAEASDDQVTQPTAEELTEAQELGWVDQEHFRGDPERWVGAKTYLARGRDVLPLLRKNNERLRGELRQDREKISQLEAKISAGDESVEELKKFHKDLLKQKVKEARETLIADIRAAKDSDDPDALTNAIAGLSQFDAEQAVASKADVVSKGNGEDTETRRQKLPPEPPAWWKTWREANSWLGKDRKRTIAAQVIAEELRADPTNKDLKGSEFMAKLDEELATEMGEDAGRVEGGGRGPARADDKSFNSLPAEAKATAKRQVPKMVGPGKAFKTEKDWFKYYAETVTS